MDEAKRRFGCSTTFSTGRSWGRWLQRSTPTMTRTPPRRPWSTLTPVSTAKGRAPPGPRRWPRSATFALLRVEPTRQDAQAECESPANCPSWKRRSPGGFGEEQGAVAPVVSW